MKSSEKEERTGFLTVAEFAEATGFSVQRVGQLLRQGVVGGSQMKRGGKWLIPGSELERFRGGQPEFQRRSAVVDSLGGTANISWARQMEQSGHWPDLRSAAVALRDQLHAPLQQLLDLSPMDLHNPRLHLPPPGMNNPVSMEVEATPEFQGLQQHLSSSPVWELLEQWKGQVKDVRGRLETLVQLVNVHPEIRDQARVSPEPPMETQIGITDRFAPTVVLNSVEIAYFGRSANPSDRSREYEMIPPRESNIGVLRWNQGSMSYVIGSDSDFDRLGQLRLIHSRLIEDLIGDASVQEMVDSIREMLQVKSALVVELEQMQRRAVFSRSCSLCT